MGLLAGHGLHPLDHHRACRDAYTTTSPALGARRGGDPEGSVDTDSNASFAGEVERHVSRDNDYLLRGSLLRGELLKTLPLVVDQSAVSGDPVAVDLAGRASVHSAGVPPP
jgi:hypothetical protein